MIRLSTRPRHALAPAIPRESAAADGGLDRVRALAASLRDHATACCGPTGPAMSEVRRRTLEEMVAGLDAFMVEMDRKGPSGAGSGTARECLSPREREVLCWVSRGKSNSVIADILGISQHTVDTHIRRIFRKLGTTDRTTASIRAMETGQLPALV